MIQDFLLNPNIAYLLLVGGFSLALMAILAPGTGLLEISAFFSLLLAGYGIYMNPINYWALAVLILGIFPFVWAIRKSGRLTYLGLSILTLVIGSAYLYKGEVWWKPAVNLVLAIAVSLFVGGYFWIIARKAVEAEAAPPSHDLSELINAIGETKSRVHHEGSVQVNGELWAARSDEDIPPGVPIRVISREGFILEVIMETDEAP
jgi:membrane-bound serine protease (ClpP class)